MAISCMLDLPIYARQVAGVLRAEPVSGNVIATVLERTLSGGRVQQPEDLWLCALQSHSPVGAAMRADAYNLFCTRQPDGAVRECAEVLHWFGEVLPGVTAEQRAAETFAARWCELNGVDAELQIAHHAHVLDGPGALVAPQAVQGRASLAQLDDVDLLADWLHAFHAEAIPSDPEEDPLALARRRVEAGEIWLWSAGTDAHPVAMAACGAIVHDTARIGPVFTPPDERGHGYAAAVTSAAATGAFEAGAARVMLYADQSNPVSNGVYRRIGFRHDHDAVDYGFR